MYDEATGAEICSGPAYLTIAEHAAKGCEVCASILKDTK